MRGDCGEASECRDDDGRTEHKERLRKATYVDCCTNVVGQPKFVKRRDQEQHRRLR
jgi:hypothetical protein